MTGAKARDPLDATPVVATGVEATRDGQGRTRLRRRGAPRNRVAAWLERVLGFENNAQFTLDEHGGAYWELIDGNRDLHAIERELRARFSATPEQSKEAVITYTSSLMSRGLVCLRLESSDGHEGGAVNA